MENLCSTNAGLPFMLQMSRLGKGMGKHSCCSVPNIIYLPLACNNSTQHTETTAMSTLQSLASQNTNLILPKEVYDRLPMSLELWDQVKSYFTQEEVIRTNCKMAQVNRKTYEQCNIEWQNIVFTEDNMECVMTSLARAYSASWSRRQHHFWAEKSQLVNPYE